ncbi:MAG TPA: DNA translocase FtsK 4TM domain-containing protein, partial [Pseudolabrys sp.]
MRATDRSFDIISFVSEHFRDVIRRRLSELAGLALIALALLGALALATWSVQDPSLSHATQKPIHNLLGFPGAVFSDLAMQLLGLAAILLLIPEALLGWRLISHKPVGEKWRGMLWIVATFLGAAFASTLPRIGSWPLPTGLGGVAGDAILRIPAMIVGGHVAGLGRLILCIVFGLATVVTLAMAAKAPHRARKSVAREIDEDDEIDEDESDDDRGSAWLGMIVHALLSWKARIGRMIRGEARTRMPMAPARGPRLEPRFDGDGLAVGEYEDDIEEDSAPRRRTASRSPARRSGSGYTLPSLN